MFPRCILRVKDQGETKEGIIVRALRRDKNQGTTKEHQITATTQKIRVVRLEGNSRVTHTLPDIFNIAL